MEFFSRIYDRLFPRYRCYLILGDSGEKPAWHWACWQTIFPRISLLAEAFELKPSVHSRQTVRGKSAAVRLGRLFWSEVGHQRWCHHSPLTKDRCHDWSFIDAEVFMPSRSTLLKTRAYPAAYLQLSDVRTEGERRTAYDQKMLLAIRLREFLEHEGVVRQLVIGLQDPLRGVLTLSETRRVVSLNQFESITLEDFTYVGMLEDELPDLSRLRGKWTKEF